MVTGGVYNSVRRPTIGGTLEGHAGERTQSAEAMQGPL